MTPGDEGWRDSQPQLVERIRDEISASAHGRVTFARFMQRALTEPDLGYYTTSDSRPTRKGDFLTAPELHPLFGRCIGRFLVGAAARLESPTRLSVREYGAGSGTLEQGVRGGLSMDDTALADGLEWRGVDVPGRGSDEPTGRFTGVVVANEFLDALPVHRLIQSDGELREAWIEWRDGWFAEVAAPLSDATLAEPVVAAGSALAEGQRVEVCPAAGAWLAAVAEGLDAGIVLVMDYGHRAAELYGPRRMAGSLVTYRDHVAGDDPYVGIGRQDITAHVDTSALARVAGDAGLLAVGDTTQAEFLTRLGLGDLLGDLGRQPATGMREYAEARAAVARLVDPRHLGGFRVLAWERSDTPRSSALHERPDLPGFARA